MNQTIEVIKSRRSIRKFKSDQVEKEVIDQIIEAGLYAPSAHNQQPWYFTVIQDKELIKELNIEAKEAGKLHSDEMIKKMSNNEKLDIFYGAPTLILISGQNDAMAAQADCGAATQNMLLAAESLDVGTCWNGFINLGLNGPKKATLFEKLQIPDNHTPFYAVALGYKDFTPTGAPSRREARVNYL